jgi:hypothetical protein
MMYENAEEAIARILTLVEKCPDGLKEKCFEVLLRGYVETELSKSVKATVPAPPPGKAVVDGDVVIPEAVLPRFKVTAKRLAVDLAALASLFDFGNDPFTFYALVIPGKNKAEKTRRAALLIGAKAYLTTGNWIADWQEVKAECINQNCYDANNQAVNLQSGDGAVWFKSVETGKNIEFTTDGIKEAEKLLVELSQTG